MKIFIQVTFGIRRNFFLYPYKYFIKENSNLPLKFFFKKSKRMLPILKHTLHKLNAIYSNRNDVEVLVFCHPRFESVATKEFKSLKKCKFVYVYSMKDAYAFFKEYTEDIPYTLEIGCDYDDIVIIPEASTIELNTIYNMEHVYIIYHGKVYPLKAPHKFISYVVSSSKVSGFRGLGLRFCIMDYKWKVTKVYPNSFYVIKTSTHHACRYISNIDWEAYEKHQKRRQEKHSYN